MSTDQSIDEIAARARRAGITLKSEPHDTGMNSRAFDNQLAGTAAPERRPGIGFSFGAGVVTDTARYGVPRADGLMFWSGSLNTRFWIHRAQQLTG